MFRKYLLCLLSLLCAVLVASEIYCQEPSDKSDVTSELELLKQEFEKMKEKIQALENEAAARRTLQVKEEEKTEAKRAEEILKASAERYSLLKSGRMELEYTFDYSYLSEDVLVIDDTVDGPVTSVGVAHSKEHTFTNTLRTSYGILDNLTFDARFPFVYKYEKVIDKNVSDLGDILLGFEYQPFKKADWPTTILSAFYKTKSGTSQYEIDPNEDLSTGSGYNTAQVGINLSKVIDPAVFFGSLSYNYAFEENDLWQNYGDDNVLVEVDPGNVISYSLGLGYSLSYNISLTMQLQQSFTDYSYYWFDDGRKVRGDTENQAMFVFGTGIRISPKAIVYVNAGMGLTEDSPDFLFSCRVPFEFALFEDENK